MKQIFLTVVLLLAQVFAWAQEVDLAKGTIGIDRAKGIIVATGSGNALETIDFEGKTYKLYRTTMPLVNIVTDGPIVNSPAVHGTISVADANGNVIATAEDYLSVAYVKHYSLEAVKTDIACNADDNGSITISVLNNNSPAADNFTYAWSGAVSGLPSSRAVSGLQPGSYSVVVTDDEKYCFLMESGAGSGNSLLVKSMDNPDSPFVRITDDQDYFYSPFEVIDDQIYIFTNYGADKGRVCRVSAKAPQIANWEEVIPEQDNVIVAAEMAAGKMIVTFDQDAANHAFVYTLDGEMLHEIALPTFGEVGFSSRYDEDEVYYGFTSFVYPMTVFKYDIEKNTSTVFRAPQVDFKPEDFTTEQVFVISKDGTKVPMFLTYKKNLKKDGTNPTFLYGYGGFNITLNPGFSTSRLPFLENGGIYAQMNLRGGNEYGEEWHLAGTKLSKQNVFDDCIACAEYLIENGYTSPDYLSLNGGSNGGLLVGAVVNQRPDLFRVAVPQVGVMDMLRYHLFTIGWNWASDYGTSEDDEAMFKALYAYSPLHTIKSGEDVHYPAIMVTTADHDDRVVPAHSFKYAAALQAAQTGTEPKIIRIDTKAGHGGGKPVAKVIEEQADIYSFILYNMGLKYPEK